MSYSPAKRVYLLDTNVLFEFSRWMPIPLNKVFWSKLENSLHDSDWTLLDVVVDEIKYDEELKNWCKNQSKNGLVKNIDVANRERAIEINNTYKMIDEVSQKSTADTYLIAYAEANKLVIFSREKERINDTDLYKIPDVCRLVKVDSIRKPRIFLEAIGFKN